MHNRKKFRLKSAPPSTYLFVTVMRMLAPQYDRMGTSGLDGTVGTELPWEGRVGMNGLSSSWSGPMSARKESCFSFSAIVGIVEQFGVEEDVRGGGGGDEEEKRRWDDGGDGGDDGMWWWW